MPKQAATRPALGQRIRALREAAGLTQAQLAYAVHGDPSHIARIERGVIRNPGVALLGRIAEALGASTGALLGEEGTSVLDAIASDGRLTRDQRDALIRIVREMTRKR